MAWWTPQRTRSDSVAVGEVAGTVLAVGGAFRSRRTTGLSARIAHCRSSSVRGLLVSALVVLTTGSPALADEDDPSASEIAETAGEWIGSVAGSVAGSAAAGWATKGTNPGAVAAAGAVGGKMGEEIGGFVGRESVETAKKAADTFSIVVQSTPEEFCLAVGGQPGCGGDQ